jgi:hypothetical protein
MWELRLGDDVDDFCIKCKRLTNHTIVSLIDEKPAKVRCRACYNDHDFRNGEAPPSKKELAKKEALFNEVLGSMRPGETADSATEAPAAAAPAKAAKKTRGAKS